MDRDHTLQGAPPGMYGLPDEPWMPPGPAGPAGWSLTLPEPSAARFDPSIAHPARIYDYWLGGKDHFPADRHAAEAVIRHRPQVVTGARANRAFLGRVVRYLAAERSIRQFLDIGTGAWPPTAPPHPARS